MKEHKVIDAGDSAEKTLEDLIDIFKSKIKTDSKLKDEVLDIMYKQFGIVSENGEISEELIDIIASRIRWSCLSRIEIHNDQVDKNLEIIKKLIIIINKKLENIRRKGKTLSLSTKVNGEYEIVPEGGPVVFIVNFRYPCKERKLATLVYSGIDTLSLKESTFKFEIDRHTFKKRKEMIEEFSDAIVSQIDERVNNEINKFYGKSK